MDLRPTPSRPPPSPHWYRRTGATGEGEHEEQPVSLPGHGFGGGRYADPRLDVLTGREREVMRLIAAGCTNDEIAARLVVSPLTAKTHVSRIMARLGAGDRSQVVVHAYEYGMVSPGWLADWPPVRQHVAPPRLATQRTERGYEPFGDAVRYGSATATEAG